jgi:hypothetical protein
VFIAAPAFLVLLLASEFLPRFRTPSRIPVEIGDPIIYRKQKVSTHPSPRAYDVHPASQGDTYVYFIDKFWTVERVLRDGQILVATRTNKHHYLRPNDPNLHKARWYERLRYWKRFPRLAVAA